MFDQDMSLGNLDQVTNNNFDPMPVGQYQLRAVGMDLRETKAGNGKYIRVEFDVIGGQFEGRKIFDNFNVINQNSQAVEIALASIKSWLIATGANASGELKLSAIESLEGKSFMAKIGIQRDKSGQYEDQNTIKKFLAPASTGQVATPAAQQSSVDMCEQAEPKKPWEK